jgi:two-component system, OmpR family, alkaline phosphatase synthesis response regulator PhoP
VTPRAVLLAEREPDVDGLARRYLVRAGLRVTVAASAEDTMTALTAGSAGVAVLDLTMPGLDARRVRRLVADPAAPTPAVYLIGASMRPRDLRVSADHCLRRPFSPRMLVSRVLSAAPGLTSAAPGLTPATKTPGTPSAPAAPPASGNLTLDPVTRRVITAGGDTALTPAEFALLSALAAHPGRVLTRARLQAAMDRPRSARAVDVHIAQLRAKLGAELSAAIRTVRGVGYILDTGPNTGVPATPLTWPR